MNASLVNPLALLVAATTLLGTACSSGDDDDEPRSATETNVAPAPCDSNADCPETLCLHWQLEDGSEGPGFCEHAD
jgi:hypothetical protein